MARPQKEGLDYFPLDVTLDMDDKFQLLEAQHGIEGFGVIIKLYMKIYSEGYFYQWGEKESLLFSKRINVDINKVNVIINDALRWKILDEGMYNKYKILTSGGIQKRYMEAVKRRQSIEIIGNYVINGHIKGANVHIKLLDESNNPQRKEENRREKKRIAFITVQHLSMTKEEYDKLVSAHGQSKTDNKIEYAKNYAKLKNYTSLYLTINNWLKADKDKQPAERHYQNAATYKEEEITDDTFKDRI